MLHAGFSHRLESLESRNCHTNLMRKAILYPLGIMMLFPVTSDQSNSMYYYPDSENISCWSRNQIIKRKHKSGFLLGLYGMQWSL